MCRHDAPILLCNMTTTGELPHSALALLRALLDTTEGFIDKVGVAYKKGCEMATSVRTLGLLPEHAGNIIWSIGSWNVSSHDFSCQMLQTTKRMWGFGLPDGGGCARLWSQLGELARSTRTMSRCNRETTLSVRFEGFAEHQMEKAFKTCDRKRTQAEKNAREATAATQDCLTALQNEEAWCNLLPSLQAAARSTDPLDIFRMLSKQERDDYARLDVAFSESKTLGQQITPELAGVYGAMADLESCLLSRRTASEAFEATTGPGSSLSPQTYWKLVDAENNRRRQDDRAFVNLEKCLSAQEAKHGKFAFSLGFDSKNLSASLRTCDILLPLQSADGTPFLRPWLDARIKGLLRHAMDQCQILWRASEEQTRVQLEATTAVGWMDREMERIKGLLADPSCSSPSRQSFFARELAVLKSKRAEWAKTETGKLYLPVDPDAAKKAQATDPDLMMFDDGDEKFDDVDSEEELMEDDALPATRTVARRNHSANL